MKINACPACKGIVSSSARRCPHCGRYVWSTGRIVFAIFCIPFVILFAVAVGTCSRMLGR